MLDREFTRSATFSRVLLALLSVVFVCVGAYGQSHDDGGMSAANWHVFIVATNDYPSGVPSLECTLEDAREMRKLFLEHGVPEKNITLLLSSELEGLPYKESSSHNIKSSFTEFCNSLGENSGAFVFFSGHGFVDGNTKQWNYAPKNIRKGAPSTYVPIQEIMDELSESKARFKWVCVDACRNPYKFTDDDLDGETANSVSGLASRDMEARDVVDATQLPQGVVHMFSCRNGQKSWENPDLKHGYFTLSFINAVCGKAPDADQNGDGDLTFNELSEYLKRDVSSKAPQNPEVKFHAGDENEIGNYKIFLDIPVLGVSVKNWQSAEEKFQAANKLLEERNYDSSFAEIERAIADVQPAYALDASAIVPDDSKRDALFRYQRLKADALVGLATAEVGAARSLSQSGEIQQKLADATNKFTAAEDACKAADKFTGQGESVEQIKERVASGKKKAEAEKLYHRAYDACYPGSGPADYKTAKELIVEAVKLSPEDKNFSILKKYVELRLGQD